MSTPPPDNPPRAGDSSIKETIESIIIAFILAFVFRAFVVEAFVIPTGSMAPTLLGQHLHFVCPEGGYAFNVGPRDYPGDQTRRSDNPLTFQGKTHPQRQSLRVHCPMCEYPVSYPIRRTDAGDRILVLKYVYAFSEPRRWDVVVFKNPERPAQNYIKRLVGLPNEYLWIVRGNVFTRSSDDPDEPWQVQRKPDRVQRVVWLPIYHSQYMPRDGGQVSLDESSDRMYPWQRPWRYDGPTAERWSDRAGGRAFAYDGGADQQQGHLRFDFADQPPPGLRRRGDSAYPASALDYYAYNEYTSSSPFPPPADGIVEDLRIGTTVTAEAEGLGLQLNLTIHNRAFRGVIDSAGRAYLESRLLHEPPNATEPADPTVAAEAGTGSWQRVAESAGQAQPFQPDQPQRVELWHADQRLSLWRDGERVAQWSYGDQLPLATLRHRLDHDISQTPQVSIAVSGAPVVLEQVNLDRDLYYTQADQYTQVRPRATRLERHGFYIPPDQFFCLGDNSPQSSDSRLWSSVDPWIRYRITQLRAGERSTVKVGVVPRELMLGRAFFVYFPAPFGLQAGWHWLIPNFGQMRVIN